MEYLFVYIPGLCKTSFSMNYKTHGMSRKRAIVYICMCGVVEYRASALLQLNAFRSVIFFFSNLICRTVERLVKEALDSGVGEDINSLLFVVKQVCLLVRKTNINMMNR